MINWKKIDWGKKLTSRKWWLGVSGGVAGIIIALTGNSETAQLVCGIILSAASIVAYIIGEGLADSAHAPEIEEQDKANE